MNIEKLLLDILQGISLQFFFILSLTRANNLFKAAHDGEFKKLLISPTPFFRILKFFSKSLNPFNGSNFILSFMPSACQFGSIQA